MKTEEEELSASSQNELKQLQQTVSELQSELRAEVRRDDHSDQFLGIKV